MTTWSHNSDSHIELDDTSERTTEVLSHLDGVLDETMLAALSGVWSTLEHASTHPAAHARAVRSRLFWQTLAPGGEAAAPFAAPVAFAAPHEGSGAQPEHEIVATDERPDIDELLAA